MSEIFFRRKHVLNLSDSPSRKGCSSGDQFNPPAILERISKNKTALREMGVKVPLTDLNLSIRHGQRITEKPLDFIATTPIGSSRFHAQYKTAGCRHCGSSAPAPIESECLRTLNVVAATRPLNQPFTITEGILSRPILTRWKDISLWGLRCAAKLFRFSPFSMGKWKEVVPESAI